MKLNKQYLFKYSDNFEFDEYQIEPSNGSLQLLYAYSSSLTYSTSNPSIVTKKSIPLNAINSFVTTVVFPSTATNIKYTLIKDGQDYYYSSGWKVSDGSYSKSTTLAEIQANLSTFTTDRCRVKIRMFLHTDDGAATPSISSLLFGYDFTGYSCPDDVRALMGNAGIAQLDDEDLLGAIEIADGQVDSYLSNYDLPLTTIPAQIRGYSSLIASYNLYSSLEINENSQTKSPQRVRYEQAIRELDSISKGYKGIVGLTASTKDTYVYSSSENITEENDVSLMFDNYNGL